MVVAETEGVVVVSSVFVNADGLGVVEDVDEALIGLLSFKVEGDIKAGMVLQVPDQNVVPAGLQDHNFTLVQEGEGVHILFKDDFTKKFAVVADVSQAVLPETSDTQKHDGLVEGGAQVEDLQVSLGELDVLTVREQHLQKIISKAIKSLIKIVANALLAANRP